MLADLVAYVSVGLFALISTFILILPQFDVVKYIAIEGEIFHQGLSWLNWFVPVDDLFIITGAWVSALAIYQAYLIFSSFYFKLTN